MYQLPSSCLIGEQTKPVVGTGPPIASASRLQGLAFVAGKVSLRRRGGREEISAGRHPLAYCVSQRICGVAVVLVLVAALQLILGPPRPAPSMVQPGAT